MSFTKAQTNKFSNPLFYLTIPFLAKSNMVQHVTL